MDISNFSAAEIGILWDLEYCPIPVGFSPESVSQNIKLALKNMGYIGAVSISAYSLTKETKKDFKSAGITLHYARSQRDKRIHLFTDCCSWGAQHRHEPSNLMLISKDLSEDRFYISALELLKAKGNNILLAQPQIAVGLLRTIPSAIWLWTFLSAGKSPLHNQSESGSSQVVAPCLTSSPRTESSICITDKQKKKKRRLADKKNKRHLAVNKKITKKDD